MTDIEEITAGLMETFREMKAGAIDRADASEIANVAGKVISAYKTRIAYHALRGEAPEIPGLGSTPRALAIDEQGPEIPGDDEIKAIVASLPRRKVG